MIAPIKQNKITNINYGVQTQNNISSKKLTNAIGNKTLCVPSLENVKANYMLGFKGNIDVERSEVSSIGLLKHCTSFFRDPCTDDTVQSYIREHFKEGQIKIVSGACSSGEEAKSYAMMLDDLKDRLEIEGFDISSDIIEKAKENKTQLVIGRVIKEPDGQYTEAYTSLDKEKFLIEGLQRNGYLKKCEEKFYQYYKDSGKTRYVQDQSEDDVYYIVRDFDEKRPPKCHFITGDVQELENLYPHKSINVLLYRNALYQTLCKVDDKENWLAVEGAEKIMNNIARQMNKVVKKGGLVVFGKSDLKKPHRDIVINCMKNSGFSQFKGPNGFVWERIWVKTRNIKTDKNAA